MVRTYTGPVTGGRQTEPVWIERERGPVPFDILSVEKHARGRSDTMAEVLHHCVYLKSRGLIRAEAVVSPCGARLQDFRGKTEIPAAHQAICTVLLDSMRTDQMKVSRNFPKFRAIMVAPQARTDFVGKAVNYSDNLLEEVLIAPALDLFRTTIIRQPGEQRLEVNMLSDAIFRFRELSLQNFDRAADLFQERRQKEGWISVPISRLGEAGFRDLDIDARLDRFEENLRVDEEVWRRPSQQLPNPEIFLGMQKDAVARAIPELVKTDVIEERNCGLDKARAANSNP